MCDEVLPLTDFACTLRQKKDGTPYYYYNSICKKDENVIENYQVKKRIVYSCISEAKFIFFVNPPFCHTKEAKIQKRLNSKIVMPGPPKVNIRRGARRAQRQANRAQRWAQRAQQLAPRAQQWAPRAQWLAQWAQSGHRAGTERERGEAWFSHPPRSTRKCQLWTPKGAQTMSFCTLREVHRAPCSPRFFIAVICACNLY